MMGGDHSKPYGSGWDDLIDVGDSMDGGESAFLGAGGLGGSNKRTIHLSGPSAFAVSSIFSSEPLSIFPIYPNPFSVLHSV